MDSISNFLEKMGLPARDLYELPTSRRKFSDNAQFRIEIPSTEGPESLRAVIDAADENGVIIHRVSQGSGIMMLTNDEIEEMAEVGKQEKIEVSLFVGPRANYDIGGTKYTTIGDRVGWRVRGADQLRYAIEDVKRAMELGIRGVLLADEGMLYVLNEMRKEGEIPKNTVFKISVQIGYANPASAKLLEQMGADTFNVPTDLTLPIIAGIRRAINIPIDFYVETPQPLGGIARYYEVPELIRIASPVYLKFGLNLEPPIYPAGKHLLSTVVDLSKERVRRAKITLDILKRLYPDAVMSKKGVEDLGIPE